MLLADLPLPPAASAAPGRSSVIQPPTLGGTVASWLWKAKHETGDGGALIASHLLVYPLLLFLLSPQVTLKGQSVVV